MSRPKKASDDSQAAPWDELAPTYIRAVQDASTETERWEAISVLLVLYRRQCECVKRGEQHQIDPRVLCFFRDEIHRCSTLADPVGAIEQLLGKRDPGRPSKPSKTDRDFNIAVTVELLRLHGKWTITDACEFAAKDAGLPNGKQASEIYYRVRKKDSKALKAEVSHASCEGCI